MTTHDTELKLTRHSGTRIPVSVVLGNLAAEATLESLRQSSPHCRRMPAPGPGLHAAELAREPIAGRLWIVEEMRILVRERTGSRHPPSCGPTNR